MKKLSILLFVLLVLLTFGCSEKDDNPTDTNIYGYSLDQFISKTAVRDVVDATQPDSLDFRSLFAYEIVSADSLPWSPRMSSNAGYDLPWESYKQGFYVPSDSKKTWFPPVLGIPGAFKVRNAGTIKLYRKVDVNTTTTNKLVELKGLALHSVNNWNSTPENAIKLSDLLQGIAVWDTVRFVSSDGYTRDYTPEQVNDGYYLLNSEVTTFPTLNDSMTGGQRKFKKLAAIEVISAEAQVFSFPLASHEDKSIEFAVPTDLSGYDSAIMTDY
ncbi:MAG: hypothetical protein RBS43_00140 [Candidatus Cloacimonas sp.]|jgi:hypothetical protein|nr:hypothetical protein [Candidatus Cloacimonas sp.]